MLLGHPGSPKKSSDFYDYYADEYSDYSSDDDYLTEDERVVHTIPKFVSREVQTVVNEGDTIKLPCFVDKLGETMSQGPRGGAKRNECSI